MPAKYSVPEDADLAPPVPEDPGLNSGRFVLGLFSVALSVFLLWQAVSPIVWGEVVSVAESWFTRYETAAVRADGLTEVPASELAYRERIESYRRFRWLHWTLAVAGLITAVGLAVTGYLLFAAAETPTSPATIFLALGGGVIVVDGLLGWGNGVTITIGILALAASGALFHPRVRQFLDDELIPAVEAPVERKLVRARRPSE